MFGRYKLNCLLRSILAQFCVGLLSQCCRPQPAMAKAAGKAKAASKAKAKGKKLTPKAKSSVEADAKAAARQAILENPAFKGFSSTLIYSTMIGGLTLYDKVYQDKLDAVLGKPGAPKFGLHYYKPLAAKYRSVDSGSCGSVLRPSDAGLSLDDDLIQAMIGWESVPKLAGPMMQYLQLGQQVLL